MFSPPFHQLRGAAMRARFLARARLLACVLAALPLAGCAVPDNGNRSVIYAPAPGAAGPGAWTLGRSPSPYGYGVQRGGYGGFWGTPGWSDERPRSRTFRPERRVTCDRRTQICYKRGDIDKSSTENHFGDRAGDRADRFRDRFGSDAFITGRNSYCDRGDKVCYKNGHRDRSDTRKVFGKKAARRID
jgi:hypothetical protein